MLSLIFKITLQVILLCSVTVGQPTFVLDRASYPDVVDHHCIAQFCGSINGFGRLHRDVFASAATKRNRRQTVGCGGYTDCMTYATSRSCDEIPYASTFDGGLGCYTTGYPGPLTDLYDVATHRCVDAEENSAHGLHLEYFYELFQIGQGGEFNVALEDQDPNLQFPAYWCGLTNLIYYAEPLDGQELEAAATLCYLQSRDQTNFRRIDVPGYTGRCPSRGIRRRDNQTRAEELADRLNQLQVVTLESGERIFPLFGHTEVGHDMWFGPGESESTGANLTESIRKKSSRNSKVASVQSVAEFRASRNKQQD